MSGRGRRRSHVCPLPPASAAAPHPFCRPGRGGPGGARGEVGRGAAAYTRPGPPAPRGGRRSGREALPRIESGRGGPAMGGGAPGEPRWPGGAAPAAGEGIVDECAGGSSRPSEMKGSLRKASRSLAPFNNRAAAGCV